MRSSCTGLSRVAASAFGPRFHVAVAVLSVRNRVSRRDVVECCEQLFGGGSRPAPSRRSSSGWPDALAEPDADLLERVRAAGRPLGLEAVGVRECRRPHMPNEIGPHLEQRILAFSLAHPGFGPRRISAELRREKWGGSRISEHGLASCAASGSTRAASAWRSSHATATPMSAGHLGTAGAQHKYLTYHNIDCAHTGRLTRGRVPADIAYGATKMGARP